VWGSQLFEPEIESRNSFAQRGVLILNHEHAPAGGGAAKASLAFARRLPGSRVLTMRFAERAPDASVIEASPRRPAASRCAMWRMLLFAFTAFARIALAKPSSRPRVIVAFFTIPAGLTALFSQVCFGIPYIVWLRGGDVPGFTPRTLGWIHALLRPIIHLVWRRASVVAANGPELARLAGESLPSLEVVDWPNGVDLPPPTERPTKPLRVVFAGRLVEEQKGLEALPAIWRELVDRFGDLDPHLDIVGDGPMRRSLERDLANESVSFLGWIPREDVGRRMGEAHLLLAPSPFEGVSNTVLEGLAAGCLILVDARSSGWLPAAPGVFHATSEVTLDDFSQRSAANRALAATYDWEHSTARLRDALESLLDAGEPLSSSPLDAAEATP